MSIEVSLLLALKADPWIIIKFTAALNQSTIRTIDFTGNTQLGDTFLTSLLFNLRAPHLRELSLSVLGLTPAARQPLIAYLTAPASRPLKILKLNGNALNRAFVDDLLGVLKCTNVSLVHVEVYSNRLNDRPPPSPPVGGSPTASVQSLEGAGGLPSSSSLGSLHYSPPAISPSLPPAVAAATHSSAPPAPPQATSPPPPPPTWVEVDGLLRALLQRNQLYASITRRQAVRLLLYARALFLRTTSALESQEFLKTGKEDCRTNTNTNILILPAELQISILHSLVPVLSPAQCHRVCRYVSCRFSSLNRPASVCILYEYRRRTTRLLFVSLGLISLHFKNWYLNNP